jgi:hypothetical protein
LVWAGRLSCRPGQPAAARQGWGGVPLRVAAGMAEGTMTVCAVAEVDAMVKHQPRHIRNGAGNDAHGCASHHRQA